MAERRLPVYFLLIGFLLAGLFTGRAFFFNLAGVLGGLLVIAFVWSFFAVRGLSITRSTNSFRLQVGGQLEEAFTIRNVGFLPKLWLEIRDESTFPHHRAGIVAPALSWRGRYAWTVTTPCVTRGIYQLGPIVVRSGDPFGLFAVERRLAATSRVLVYPAAPIVPAFDLPLGVLSGGAAQRCRTHDVTPYVAGIRDYTPGDGYNRVHWKQTAKRGRMMVKEFETDPQTDVWLFVDFALDALIEDPNIRRIDGIGAILTHPLAGRLPPSTEEYAVAAAAALARHFLIDQRRSVSFTAYTPAREMFMSGRGEAQYRRILNTLAVARSLSPYSLAEVLALEAVHLTRRTSVILVTAAPDSAWIARTQILAVRGLRPVCVLIDAGSFGGPSIDEARSQLRAGRIPTTIIRRGDDLATALLTGSR